MADNVATEKFKAVETQILTKIKSDAEIVSIVAEDSIQNNDWLMIENKVFPGISVTLKGVTQGEQMSGFAEMPIEWHIKAYTRFTDVTQAKTDLLKLMGALYLLFQRRDLAHESKDILSYAVLYVDMDYKTVGTNQKSISKCGLLQIVTSSNIQTQ